MNHHFTLESLEEFINIYDYPVLIVDEENYPITINNAFKKIKNINFLEIQNKLNNPITPNEYNINKIDEEIVYSLNFSKLTIENKKYTIISFFDISIRKKLIDDLKEKQNLFNNLTEQLPEGIVLFEDQIIYTNDTFENFVGYSSKNLHQKKFTEMFDFDNQQFFQDNLDKLLLSRKLKVEFTIKILRNYNTPTLVKIKIKKMKHSNKNLFLAVISDISKEVKQIQELTRLANYDKLTNIFNRRKFDELLDMEYKITKRYERNLSALFFDIDHFKNVNDTYGHDAGDLVLSGLSSLISKQIRETDIFARWGGEEFIILLPETTTEKAMIMANEIMTSLSIHTFPKVGHVTVSIGISSVKKERLQSFLKRLDNALYKAKEEGRNRYIVL